MISKPYVCFEVPVAHEHAARYVLKKMYDIGYMTESSYRNAVKQLDSKNDMYPTTYKFRFPSANSSYKGTPVDAFLALDKIKNMTFIVEDSLNAPLMELCHF